MQTKIIIGKIGYGITFIIVIPALLILWAKYTEISIQLPVPGNQFLNYSVMLTGLFFIISGMLHLLIFGKGLPMNAFPPKYFVTNGIYAITKHPIYFGSVIFSFGLSAVMQSASGFWFVSPLFTLMIIAYTIGFENERTQSVFGKQTYRPLFSISENSIEKPAVNDKIAAYILTYLPWLLIYEAFIFLGAPKDAIYTNIALDNQIPFLEFSAVFYVSIYLLALLIPLMLKTKNELRNFEIDVWLATGIAGFLYFTLPFLVKQQDFTPHSFWGDILWYDRSSDGESASFPAFHVIWAFLFARYFSIRFNKLKFLWFTLAILISISCLTTGSHSILDVIAGVFVFIIVRFRIEIWDFIRFLTERLANSWKEWRFGKVRIINHGFYAGAANFVGTILIGSFLGGKYAISGFLIGVFGITGAALWAQFVEGSPKLQRPYGYYGGVIGVFFACVLIIILFPVNFYIIVAASAFAAPWIQLLGRLRCLVQGCCHGKPVNDKLGIRFTHPYSRVNKISGLQGAFLHPTQLYSIGTNIITGLVLIRLFNLNRSAGFIIGMYLILNGIGRFVEEYFRGEAQTPYWAGMRIYQWLAVLSIMMGAVFTCLPSVDMIGFQLTPALFYWATALGILTTIAYGVDFPQSNRRFARLTSA
ncbi:MAG: prolipoprotein diacylglyceryl transferase [Bacteroidetes bacterium]|nr:prolipoprotein diacylglyceryl transferase [Bacteroidota bacterium]